MGNSDSKQILTDMEKIVFTTLILASSSQAGHYYPSSNGGYASARQTRQSGNIVEELTNNGASTLIDLAVKAGLAETLTGDGPFTVFAPTNAAFAALPADLVAAVTSDVELLKKVLLYHVVPGTVTSDQASNDITLKTVEGTTLRVNVYRKPRQYGSTITVNGKKVSKADVKATNGVIHFIDGVMLIPAGDLVDVLAADPRFSTLVTAVQAADLVNTVKEAPALTIFAPTNDAFAKVPEATLQGLLADKEALSGVLLRHVVPGALFSPGVTWANLATAGGEKICTKVQSGGVKVGSYSGGTKTQATVVEADITATNGVVHAIDTVI